MTLLPGGDYFPLGEGTKGNRWTKKDLGRGRKDTQSWALGHKGSRLAQMRGGGGKEWRKGRGKGCRGGTDAKAGAKALLMRVRPGILRPPPPFFPFCPSAFVQKLWALKHLLGKAGGGEGEGCPQMGLIIGDRRRESRRCGQVGTICTLTKGHSPRRGTPLPGGCGMHCWSKIYFCILRTPKIRKIQHLHPYFTHFYENRFLGIWKVEGPKSHE